MKDLESLFNKILHLESIVSAVGHRWWSMKTQGRTALKSGGGSLAVGSFLQRGQWRIQDFKKGGGGWGSANVTFSNYRISSRVLYSKKLNFG